MQDPSFEDFLSDDPTDDFVYIDRCALLVRPTWKFAEWLRSLDDAPPVDERSVFIQTVYLVEYVDQIDAPTAVSLLEAYFLDIASSEFGAWWTDENDWPILRNLDDFFQYFECAPSETVIDLAADADEFMDVGEQEP